jgi:uncharacterized protein (TIGR02597 family)
MKLRTYAFLAAAAACGLASAAETAYTTPVGYVSQACKASSDTIVGLPLRQPTVAAAALTSNPVIGPSVTPAVAAGKALLSVTGATFGSYGLTHYVKFSSGGSNGKFYSIVSNDATTITIDLNGDTLSALSGDTFSVIKFWTLGELFVPSASTSDANTTGNAIVATTNPSLHKTEILIPNASAVGLNPSSVAVYYLYNSAWRKTGQPTTTSFDADQLWPDTYFTIRQATMTAPATQTTYTISGEVEPGSMVVNLRTQAAVKQDNVAALPRPVDVTLNQLALGNTAAFVTTTNPSLHKDELLVFDNSVASKNKAASAIYYYYNSAWRKTGQPTTSDFGTDVIKAGNGFVVRKATVAGGPTSFWNNTAPY